MIKDENYFYDIPVYRLKEENYYEQRNEFVNKQMSGDQAMREFYLRNPDRAILAEDRYEVMFGGAWLYNEIIGYIRLYFLGRQIRGEYWQIKAEKICKTRKKIFQYRTHKLSPEIWIPANATNSEILTQIFKYLSGCQKELKGRYIDMEHLKTIGLYVDWQKMLSGYLG